MASRGCGFSVHFHYVSFCHFVKNRLLLPVCHQNVYTHWLWSSWTHNRFSKRLKSQKKQFLGQENIQKQVLWQSPIFCLSASDNTCICRNGKNLHNPNFDENCSKTSIYSEEVERFYIQVQLVSEQLIWVYISVRFIIFRQLRQSKIRRFHDQPPRFMPKTNIITSICLQCAQNNLFS